MFCLLLVRCCCCCRAGGNRVPGLAFGACGKRHDKGTYLPDDSFAGRLGKIGQVLVFFSLHLSPSCRSQHPSQAGDWVRVSLPPFLPFILMCFRNFCFPCFSSYRKGRNKKLTRAATPPPPTVARASKPPPMRKPSLRSVKSFYLFSVPLGKVRPCRSKYSNVRM